MEPRQLLLSSAGSGATPVQELAFALANAIAVLDTVKAAAGVDPAHLPAVVGRISFFVNAGMKLITGDLQAARLCPALGRHNARAVWRYDERYRRFRYGVQVNSLGLTEQQAREQRLSNLISMLRGALEAARARASAAPPPGTRHWDCRGVAAWDQQWRPARTARLA